MSDAHADGYAIFYGHGLRGFTFDEARASQLATDLHGELVPMLFDPAYAERLRVLMPEATHDDRPTPDAR